MNQLDAALLRECRATYPDPPNLDPVEWPYSRDELTEAVRLHMELIERIGA